MLYTNLEVSSNLRYHCSEVKNVILGFILCPCLDNSVILLCGAPCGLTCSHLLWGEIGWIENTWSKWDGGNPREPERERLTVREGAVKVGRLIGLVVWNSHQHSTPLYISSTMLAHFTYWVLQTKARQRVKTHRPVLGDIYWCCWLRCTLLTESVFVAHSVSQYCGRIDYIGEFSVALTWCRGCLKGVHVVVKAWSASI